MGGLVSRLRGGDDGDDTPVKGISEETIDELTVLTACAPLIRKDGSQPANH